MKNNKNIMQYNEKNQKHGYYEVYWAGKLCYKRFFHNGKEVGYEEQYFNNGKLGRKKYYL